MNCHVVLILIVFTLFCISFILRNWHVPTLDFIGLSLGHLKIKPDTTVRSFSLHIPRPIPLPLTALFCCFRLRSADLAMNPHLLLSLCRVRRACLYIYLLLQCFCFDCARRHLLEITVLEANGHHMIFMRECMFGKDYKNSKEGQGLPPQANMKSTHERLYHSETNIPLNLNKFDEGYNSDNGSETPWCLEYGKVDCVKM